MAGQGKASGNEYKTGGSGDVAIQCSLAINQDKYKGVGECPTPKLSCDGCSVPEKLKNRNLSNMEVVMALLSASNERK